MKTVTGQLVSIALMPGRSMLSIELFATEAAARDQVYLTADDCKFSAFGQLALIGGLLEWIRSIPVVNAELTIDPMKYDAVVSAAFTAAE